MRLLHLPKGLFKLLVFLIFLAAGIGLAIVRTQAGRDLVGDQIEKAFSNAFEGSLKIGQLHGNVLGTLYAIDVTLHDPRGRVVVHVDSLIARLSVIDALQRDITIRTAEFIRPTVVAVRSDSGGWNISDVFRKRSQSEVALESEWKLLSADVRVRDGEIQTINEGARPDGVQAGRVFDYTNTQYEGLHGRLTVDWGGADRLIDLINFGGRLIDPSVIVEDFHGQLIASDSSLTVGAVGLRTSASSVGLAATISGFAGFNQFLNGESKESTSHIQVDATAIDSTELSRVFPSVRLPNSVLTINATGPRDDITVNRFHVRVGRSSVDGSGVIRGLPESAQFDLSVDGSSLDTRQLARLFPALNARAMRLAPEQHLTAEASGIIRRERPDAPLTQLETSFFFQAASRLGVLDGNVEFNNTSAERPRYTADLNFFDFKVGRIVPDLRRSTVLNGHMTAMGSGLHLDELDASAELALYQTTIRDLSFDSLTVTASALGPTIQTNAAGSGPSGSIQLASVLDLSSDRVRLDATVATDRLELARAVAETPPETRSMFTLRSNLSAVGSSFDDVSGFATVAVDTISFLSPSDTVGLPHSVHRIDLSHPTPLETQLTVRGDVFEGDLEGTFTFTPLARVTSLWLGAVARTVDSQMDKRLHPEDSTLAVAENQRLHLQERDDATRYLLRSGFGDGLQIHGSLQVKRMLELNRIVGVLPEYASAVSLSGGGRLTPDGIDLKVDFSADSLRSRSVEADRVEGMIAVNGSYADVLEEFVASEVSLEADRVLIGKNKLTDAKLRFSYADKEGTLELDSRNEANDSLSVGLSAALAVLPDRNQVIVNDAFLRSVNYIWQTQPNSVIDLFGDAIRVDDLGLINRHASDTALPPQLVSVAGIVSRSYADTLHVSARYVSLDQISELAHFRDHVGGELDASIAVAHTLERPQVVGSITVRELTYVWRDVGDLHVTSTYSGEGESLFIDARISQPREEAALIRGNDARVYGTIAIPGPDSDVPFGALNINVEAKEVDLFFFEVLFSTELKDVSGKAAGKGTVTGVLAKPIFNADIQVLESDFLSPEFNLRYSMTGRVTVDSLGFHLHDALLTDRTGGSATLRGGILFNDYRYFSFNLAGDLRELLIMNVQRSEELAFYGEVWVSGSATLTGPLQRTLLRSTDVVTSPKSRLFMPVTDDEVESDQTYIVFTDSTGAYQVKQRRTMLDARPATERAFIDGMDMNFNITIPPESNVFLVFDALLGDVIEARGSGRVQFQRFEGEYAAFGTLTISSGHYLFTAGEVFQRRFILDSGGTITWDGDPIDAALNIPATYKTRASLAGLPGQNPDDRVPLSVNMTVTGRLSSPEVTLRIALDVDQREGVVIPPGLESAFNREDLAVEYATSVLLTNTFLLTSAAGADPTSSADDLLFNSLSHLISSQLNRFVSQALDLDVNVGVQQGRTDNAYDVVYGFALRLDDKGIVIRGEGLYETTTSASSSEGIQGEFVVEYRLTPAVRLEFFFRRESDLYRAASTLGTSYGAGIVYQTDFANWKSFGKKVEPPPKPEEPEEEPLEGAVPSSGDD